ncbi:flagellar export protein FliJ [Liquorilactobacillus sucicola]|uniref:flagellar export protein FliJ n=1 Tax=Liquorilactobacillus sucicola TaxID=519050 RepID=UPI002286D752|nr:flagellar export protein FliJ [Liquorilactobacillus sucicola]
MENILEYRKQNEQQIKQKYTALRQRLASKEDEITRLGAEKFNLMDVSELSVGKMQVQQRYLLELDRRMGEIKTESLELQNEVEMVLQEVVQAQRERKVLEKLEEKQHAAYLQEVKHEEQKQLDEMGNRPKFVI